MTVKIKKYSNRRLYNTDTSSYITQEDIVELIKKKINFKINDVDSEKNITSSILLQILLERQTNGTSNLIPEDFLKQIILLNENNQSSNMFSFLNSIHEFANSNNIFSQNLDKIMKFTPFNFQKFFNLLSTEENNVDKKKNTKEKNYSKNNINDHSEQLDQLKLQISKLKKKRTN